jgi:hypothetical protein
MVAYLDEVKNFVACLGDSCYSWEEVHRAVDPKWKTHFSLHKLRQDSSENAAVAVLSFRGTHWNWDWAKNLQSYPSHWHGYWVHSGFLSSYQLLEKEIKLATDNLPEGTHLIVTGHSKGAATALLAAYDLRQNLKQVKNITLITFAMPCFWDQEISKAFIEAGSTSFYRHAAPNDLVSLTCAEVPGVSHLDLPTDDLLGPEELPSNSILGNLPLWISSRIGADNLKWGQTHEMKRYLRLLLTLDLPVEAAKVKLINKYQKKQLGLDQVVVSPAEKRVFEAIGGWLAVTFPALDAVLEEHDIGPYVSYLAAYSMDGPEHAHMVLWGHNFHNRKEVQSMLIDPEGFLYYGKALRWMPNGPIRRDVRSMIRTSPENRWSILRKLRGEEPIAAPVEEPVSAPVEEPVSVPVEEPVAEPIIEPVSVPENSPVESPSPIEEPVTEPINISGK